MTHHDRDTLHRMREKKPKPRPIGPVQRIRPAVQEKIAACHFPEAESALGLAFRVVPRVAPRTGCLRDPRGLPG